jgi:hypothetical protein
MLVLLSSSIAVGLLAACSWSPQDLRKSDFVGVWVSHGPDGQESTLDLSKDGTFTIDKVPTQVFSPTATGLEPPNWGTLIPLSGSWGIPASGDTGSPKLDFSISASSDQPGLVTQLRISGSGESRVLYYFLGDPDSDVRFTYSRP